MTSKHALWVEKYRPIKLEQYVFHDETQKAAITKMMSDGTIPHLLFSGVQGSGKTTLSKIIPIHLGIDENDVLTINASDERSVDTIRDKIKSFVTTFAMSEFKIVQLEEADYITPVGQAALRQVMEEYSDNARFILTCNYENKIIPAIKSRCQQFRFKAPNRDEVTEFAATILIKEKIKFDIEDLDAYIAVGYPDIRKIINLLQQNSIDGELRGAQSGAESGDYKFELLDLITKDDWNAARKLCCENVASEEWEEVYRFLYDNLGKSKKFKAQDKWEAGIVVIAEHLYKHSIVADPEINAAAMFIRLTQS